MINRPKLSRLEKTDSLSLKRIIQAFSSCFYLEYRMRISSRELVLFITTTLAVIATATLNSGSNSAFAQTSPTLEGETLSENSISQVDVLFVNPSIGNDTNANGSEANPLKTITKALNIAKAGSVIKLAKGNYSSETGERFPLIIKKGISIEGDVRNQGKEVIIQGGGDYLSRYYGSKNIAIFADSNTKLTGVTVTNSNSRGYGLWIESGQQVVESNTFQGSTQDGIAVTGSAKSQIGKNYFYNNGANGITVSGNSQPKIEQNTFQNTGFGVNIAQNAAPQVINNKISHNRSGVVAQASSRPVLRKNSIFNNKEDGLVVIATAMPDLGSESNPGGNQFNFNGRYDINAKAAKQEVYAYGNSFSNSRVSGKVNVTASTPPVRTAIAQTPKPKPTLLNPRLRNNASVVNQPSETKQNTEEQLNYVKIDSDTIEFAAPGAAAKPIGAPKNIPSSLPQLQPAPSGESSLLPVPNASIPVSRGSKVNAPAPNTSSGNPVRVQNQPQRQARTTKIGSRYRVIVETASPREQELVKFITPDAFRTRRSGRSVMQAGIFSNRRKAKALIRQFKNNGLRARMEKVR